MQHATQDSLVVLDELGRGTSTFDGYAIAHAVLKHISSQVDCRLLFATHYHPLTAEFSFNPRISLGHMAALVGTSGRFLRRQKTPPVKQESHASRHEAEIAQMHCCIPKSCYTWCAFSYALCLLNT